MFYSIDFHVYFSGVVGFGFVFVSFILSWLVLFFYLGFNDDYLSDFSFFYCPKYLFVGDRSCFLFF